MTTVRTTATLALLATAAAVAFTGCADSSTSSAPGASRPAFGTTHAPDASAAVVPDAARRSPAGASLSSIVDLKTLVPTTYEASDDPDPTLPPSYDAALHSCLGVPSAASQVVGTASAEAGQDGSGYTGAAMNMTATRYRTQAAADREAALAHNPRAKQCYATVLLRLFRQFNDGAGVTAGPTTVRSRVAGEPGNVAGVVTFVFHTAIGGEKSYDARVTLTYVAGPKLVAGITFLEFGRDVDATAKRRLVAAVATRVAAG